MNQPDHENPMPEDKKEQWTAQENWLSEKLAGEQVPDTEWLKLKVRVTVLEEWLAGRMLDDYPAAMNGQLESRLKRSVRDELHAASEDRSKRQRRWLVSAGLATAATIALILLPTIGRSPSTMMPDTIMPNTANWIAAVPPTDELLLSLRNLADEVSEIESGSQDWLNGDDVISDIIRDIESFYMELDS